MITKIERYILFVFDAFLAVTAVAGGIGLLTGAIAPDVALLQGSPFYSYTIPGLALLVLVGGSALLATGLMVRLPELGVLASGATGLLILSFEAVEVLVIGSDPGVARTLQLLYVSLGLLMVLLAAALWLAGRRMNLNGVTPGKAV
ncbi:MAG: hypothetical protein R3E79_07430 [Caldilineaceae bacterium]